MYLHESAKVANPRFENLRSTVTDFREIDLFVYCSNLVFNFVHLLDLYKVGRRHRRERTIMYQVTFTA